MAKKKPARKAAAAKKKPAKRTTTAKKAARKPAAKSPRKAAKKAAGKPARKAAAKPARKAAAKPARKAAGKPARKAAPPARKSASRPKAKKKASPKAAPASSETGASFSPEVDRPLVVETTSAGTQALAPEHAAVDDLTSSGNELLDIFQKYDRNRTGSIEAPEFARLLEALGQNVTDEELQIALDIIDTERTGKISWKQFKNWWTSR
ncbi:EF-hand domain-containing protein [Hyalangium rubrum]|uniref:EF-hand domain-containing protein n=1 Tax=Hyalangium rubrum TaxID=3103134 RepID=A0ABU5HG41_9BACT|nr:EF-hand domain-containing protein [Hyalangium sp. s54d21]MDY7232444.1 EF-hand domain-containing protein [Hyalangium sp. s54d21]